MEKCINRNIDWDRGVKRFSIWRRLWRDLWVSTRSTWWIWAVCDLDRWWGCFVGFVYIADVVEMSIRKIGCWSSYGVLIENILVGSVMCSTVDTVDHLVWFEMRNLLDGLGLVADNKVCGPGKIVELDEREFEGFGKMEVWLKSTSDNGNISLLSNCAKSKAMAHIRKISR